MDLENVLFLEKNFQSNVYLLLEGLSEINYAALLKLFLDSIKQISYQRKSGSH